MPAGDDTQPDPRPAGEPTTVVQSARYGDVLGLFIGALLAAFMAGRFRVQLDGARSVGTSSRIGRALAGGMLAGFGARVAGGCTSGLGLSGAAALGVAAFVFLALFFATGLITSRIVRGV